jgi:hypothetical protein
MASSSRIEIDMHIGNKKAFFKGTLLSFDLFSYNFQIKNNSN